MATIEERARKSSYDNLDRLSPAYELGYISGASDQIDNACEWLIKIGFTQIREFRKAMTNG